MATRPEIELVADEALTALAAPGFCRRVCAALEAAPRRLWLNLEGVKATDVTGLAALVQAVARAGAQATPVSVLPSAAVWRALLAAGLLEELPLEGPGAGPAAPVAAPEPPAAPASVVARTARLLLRPPAWEELDLFERWAQEPLLDQMVGSPLLYLGRHLRVHDPEFVARALHDPAALTLLVVPAAEGAAPVGFVRLYGVNLLEGFAFLETAVASVHGLRAGWGVEASRLALAYAMDALGTRRVEAKVYAYNVLSVNALRRNGFRLEGRLREARTYADQRWDILVFAILEDEMRAQRARDGFPSLGLWEPDARP
ncbi:MAG: hypothetical protein A3I14_11865 [Candidatus Rokubacteria bacterium RIFCSPLOWO2_02_FULL_73_56]|nr:MAG: hypothetical protein A3D33_11665 [Candidatus Rokubacteria bacterium RIFCSPHIGHO2_02_FULL_73_26]OGL09950.1 MAG: hypothetical protein A3I14_11865 [Candidatus Rokubacteria bacterium RIFCSPLOWO2_02_FULL_73_56]OGL27452.1 MAG: hypothetical protein A3G44_18485 [Candidatus Rokubacteria bacterium RIFCSPLOWO2_12_FULL_73_47]